MPTKKIDTSKTTATAWKVSKYGGFSGPNTGKYGPEKTPYLDIFHTVNQNQKTFTYITFTNLQKKDSEVHILQYYEYCTKMLKKEY